MERLIKTREIKAKNSKDIKESKMGLGFEKLDRDAFDPSQCYEKIAKLGVKWARIQSGWAKTEKQKGVYDFKWLDDVVDNLIANGLKPWLCLCYGNGLYSEMAKKIFGAVGVAPIFDEESKQAWANYVRATVKHYRGRIDTFEVWNEPDGEWCWKTGVNATELGEFTVCTSKIIKQENKDAYIIGGVFCKRELSFINEALAAGMGDYIDAISFHEYSSDERGVTERVSGLRGLCSLYNKNIEIIQGESGSQSRSGGSGAVWTGCWTQRKQAKQLLRHAMIDLKADVKFTSYFSCMDMREALNGVEGDPESYKDFGYFGVLGADFDENGIATGEYKEKLSYRALQTISSIFCEDVKICDLPVILTPKESARIFDKDLSANDIIYQGFKKPNGSYAYVYWAPTDIMTSDFESTISLQAVYKGDDIKIVDLMDGSIYKLPEDMYEKDSFGVYKINNLPVKDYPMLIMFGDFE